MFAVGGSITDYVLRTVEACVADTGVSQTALLRRARVGKHSLRQLRRGAGINSTTIDRILAACAVEYQRAHNRGRAGGARPQPQEQSP